MTLNARKTFPRRIYLSPIPWLFYTFAIEGIRTHHIQNMFLFLSVIHKITGIALLFFSAPLK